MAGIEVKEKDGRSFSFMEQLERKMAQLPKQLQGKLTEIRAQAESAKKQGEESMREFSRDLNQQIVHSKAFEKMKNNKQLEKLLQKVGGFDTLKAGEILRMKKAGENIANFLLTDEEGDEINLTHSSVESLKNKPLLVNFGKNRSINASIGLGDILPYEVRKVQITKPNGENIIGTLGTTDSRKNKRERIGYYDESGKYIAIYGNYKVTILETGTVNTDDEVKYGKLLDEQTRKIRIDEMVTRYMQVGEKYKEDFTDPDDVALFENAEKEIKNDGESSRLVQEKFGTAFNKGRAPFLSRFGQYIEQISTQYGIPSAIMVNLIQKESNFNPTARSSIGAYGLGQHTASAWADVEEHLNQTLNRQNPYHQILALAEYLKISKERSGASSWQEAVVYYHAGTGVKEYIRTNNKEKLEAYKASNSGIAKLMQENSWKGYMDAAYHYYTDNLPETLDLKQYANTPLAQALGDWVMAASLPRTGANSCGAAVGELLNRFGIEGLPQTGRDGNKWDSFLDARSEQFRKEKINYPSEAKPGAILIYNEGAGLAADGSKRDEFGHVEIKGTDGHYYFYTESKNAAGSARVSEKNPEQYRRDTGFTGYAYYPIQKQA